MDLFYFISSLPMLKPGEKPALSHSQFIAASTEALTAPQVDALARVTLDIDGTAVEKPIVALVEAPFVEPFGILKDWVDFETFLRNNAARIRGARLRRTDITQFPTDTASKFFQDAIENAFAMPSPAEREQAFDALRWQFLDSLESGHDYDMDFLAIYALKLLLLERTQSRQLQPGLKAFQTLVASGVEQAEATRVNS